MENALSNIQRSKLCDWKKHVCESKYADDSFVCFMQEAQNFCYIPLDIPTPTDTRLHQKYAHAKLMVDSVAQTAVLEITDIFTRAEIIRKGMM